MQSSHALVARMTHDPQSMVSGSVAPVVSLPMSPVS
jgi:hypothetical protein